VKRCYLSGRGCKVPEVKLCDVNGRCVAVVRVADTDRAPGAVCWQGRLFIDRVRRGMDYVEIECVEPVAVVTLCGVARGREAGAYHRGAGV
jgi:hypothetical protein